MYYYAISYYSIQPLGPLNLTLALNTFMATAGTGRHWKNDAIHTTIHVLIEVYFVCLSVRQLGTNPGLCAKLGQLISGMYAIGLISWAANCHQAV